MDSRELPSLWQLRVFETVARHENVTRASQELLRSQPATTSCVAALEDLLGVRLFDRASTGLYLTPVGTAALVRARRVLGLAEQAVREVGAAGAVSAGVLACRVTRTQMNCLMAIADSGSFSAAARAVGISDASLQRAARNLEDTLGAKLYKRSASGIGVTAAGAGFARRLAQVKAQIETMVDTVGTYDLPRERCVTVGVLYLDPTVLLVQAMRDLGEAFPDSRIVVVSGIYQDLLQRLNSGTIDLIFGVLKHPGHDDSITERALYRERYCIVAGRDHPLARQKTVSIDELRSCDWIMPPRGSPRRVAVEHVFSEGAMPSANIETYSLSTIRMMLSDSPLLTVLSANEVSCERRIGLLTSLQVDVPWEGVVVGFTTVADWQPNEVQRAFVEAVRRASEKMALQHQLRLVSGGPDRAAA